MSKALATKNVAAVLLALSLALGVSFAFAGSAKAQTTSSNSSTLATLQAQVQALLAQIAALQGTGSSTSGSASGGACFTFTKSFSVGSNGSEVMWIQEFLNGHGFAVASKGAGSAGNETTHFGPATKAAVVAFQKANGVSPTSGYWGPLSRAKANTMCAGGSTGTTGGTTGGTTSGAGITVTAGSQPANSLAPAGASRVPFTTFTLTNNSGAAVTINGVTVQRTGLAQDAAFSGVELVDSNGVQVGIAHTFNSNHQATIGDTMTLQPGQSMTYTVAGNMASSESTYAGEVAAMSVTGVNTSVPVSGSLPISGAQQVINATLSIGSFSTSTSAFDPGAAQNKNLGDTAVKFSGLRFTAGSTEDVKIYSIRWRQVGTASNADISNVVTVANGTTYPTTVDASGRYYTSVFPGGITIAKGNTIDVYVQGDVTGSNSASRTVEFDIDKNTDVYFVGQTYGYGVTDLGCGSAQCTNTPWRTGYVTTINAGSATTISNSTKVAAQNVAPGVQNQPLGGFMTNFTGEPVSITGMTVNYATTSAAVGLITNASIVDENGKVVAGPVDATYTGSNSKAKFTFTDSVTFPVGVHYYTIQGKLPSTAGNGATVQLDTQPSAWTSPTGQTSGNSITLSQGDFTMNTMTVKAGALAVSIGTTPIAQNVIAGTQGFTFTNIVLDASQSGEDVRLNSIPVTVDNGNNSLEGAENSLSTCQLWNGSTALNGGSNVVNPSGTATTSATTHTFSFDNSLTVPKGTVVTLALKCNISSSANANSQYQIGMTSGQETGIAVTGVTSGSSITATGTAGNGQVMTVASTGSLTATAASTAVAQPALSLVPAGSTGVTVGNVKLSATNEPINVQAIGLTLTNSTVGTKAQGAAGNSGHVKNDDVVTAYIYNGSTLVGTANFTGTTATSTLSTPVSVTPGSDVTLTIKADLAAVGVTSAGGIGDTVKIDPLEVQSLGTNSSQQIWTAGTAGVNGVQMFKSIPTIGSATGACTGTGCNGTNQVIKAFTVTANASGPVSVEQLKFSVATSSATIDAAKVSVYDGNGNVSTSTFGAQINGTAMTSSPTLTYTGGPVIIPAGQSYTFKLYATVTPGASATNWSVNTTLKGDSAVIANLTSGYNAATSSIANSDTNSSFIWSDNATTTAGLNDVDWFNGYQINGLPSTGF